MRKYVNERWFARFLLQQKKKIKKWQHTPLASTHRALLTPHFVGNSIRFVAIQLYFSSPHQKKEIYAKIVLTSLLLCNSKRFAIVGGVRVTNKHINSTEFHLTSKTKCYWKWIQPVQCTMFGKVLVMALSSINLLSLKNVGYQKWERQEL